MTLLPAGHGKSTETRAAGREMCKKTRTCVSAYAYSFGTDAAVDLDVFLRKTGPQLSYFGDTPIDEFLATASCRAEMGCE